MRIPLGAQSPISNMWEKCMLLALTIVVLVIIAMMFYPPFTVLIMAGVSIFILAICSSVCLGLYDSYRDYFDYPGSKSEEKPSSTMQ
jgi:hypothetical protein